MEYTIKELATLAGVSSRTLRYYDQIKILTPKRISANGYRVYSTEQVDILQEILFYKTLDFPLKEIKNIVTLPTDQRLNMLQTHKKRLVNMRNRLDKIIQTIDKSVRYQQGEINMTDNEKFTAFKNEQVAKNETDFGNELREKYGTETIEQSNKKFKNLSQADYKKMQQLETKLFTNLEQLLDAAEINFDSNIAKEVFEAHKQWLSYNWPKYTKEMHRGLAQMYLSDPRFKAYYDERIHNSQATEVLVKIINHYTA